MVSLDGLDGNVGRTPSAARVGEPTAGAGRRGLGSVVWAAVATVLAVSSVAFSGPPPGVTKDSEPEVGRARAVGLADTVPGRVP